MTSKLLRAAATVAAVALTLPAAADARPGKGRGNGNGHAKHAAAVAPAADRSVREEPVVVDPAPVEVVPVEPAPTPVQTPVERPAKAHGRAKPKTFVFHGRVADVDVAAGTVTVRVRKGNAFARRFRGELVTFDLRTAVIAADEADGQAGISLGDVLRDDRVVLHARLPRATRPDGAVLTARRLVDLVDRAPAPVDDEPVVVEPVDEPVVD